MEKFQIIVLDESIEIYDNILEYAALAVEEGKVSIHKFGFEDDEYEVEEELYFPKYEALLLISILRNFYGIENEKIRLIKQKKAIH